MFHPHLLLFCWLALTAIIGACYTLISAGALEETARTQLALSRATLDLLSTRYDLGQVPHHTLLSSRVAVTAGRHGCALHFQGTHACSPVEHNAGRFSG